MRVNTDGNMVALHHFMVAQDNDFMIQERIDERTQELIKIHTADTDDMIAYLVEDEPETAMTMLGALMNYKSNGNPYIAESKIEASQIFFNAFVENKCKELAEKEFENE